jgi:hypothetical protein
MSEIQQVDLFEAEKLGSERQGVHSKTGTPRFFDDPNTEDVLGAKAELAFENMTGLKVDRRLLESGDCNKDFEVTINGTKLYIDVKGARRPVYLFVKEKDIQICADILVLAKVENDEVWWLGWEHKSIMRLMPKKDFGYKITNYYRHYSLLRPIWQLTNLINSGKSLI